MIPPADIPPADDDAFDVVLAQRVGVARLITAGMAGGVLLFGGVAAFALSANAPRGNPPLEFAYFASAFTALLVVASQFIPSLMMRATLTSLKTGGSPSGTGGPEGSLREQLLQCWMGGAVCRLGLLEGGAFLTLIALLVTGQWWLLCITSVPLCLILSSWPSDRGVRDWVDRQYEQVERGG